MHTDLHWVDAGASVRLALMPRPRGDDWLPDEVRAWHLAGVSHVVSLLEPHEVRDLGLQREPSLCGEAGMGFFSYPIVDRGVPASADETARLVYELRLALCAGEAIAVHCRAGIGRSALVVACVMVALGFTPAEAFARIGQARGLPVPDTPLQVEWLNKYKRHFTWFVDSV